MSTKFPTPWVVERTGPNDYVVCDAAGRKLFYIVDDEGEEGEEASVLHYGVDEGLIDEVSRMFSKEPKR